MVAPERGPSGSPEGAIDHPKGCFYGSFLEAYPDNWHIPWDVDCQLEHGAQPIRLESPWGKVWTIYQCPVPGCPAFMGADMEGHQGNGDHGWNPDGWPYCTEHNSTMKPVRVVALERVRGT